MFHGKHRYTLKRGLGIFASSLLLLVITCKPSNADEIISLCFHDVQDKIESRLSADTMTTTTNSLIEFFDWLAFNNYQPISLRQIADARNGKSRLPSKPVLLTFDDGHTSMYTRVYPLLRLYNYPAVLSLVSDWMEKDAESYIQYGEELLPRSAFVNWEQIREMQASGLVEIASHTNNMHRSIVANPQNNAQPALTSLRFQTELQSYESADQQLIRIKDDLTKSFNIFRNKLDQPILAITWPYGEYNRAAEQIASEAGITHFLTLDESKNSIKSKRLHRILIGDNMDANDISWLIRSRHKKPHHRAMQVDLDYMYDPDPKQQERNLGMLLDRIKMLGVNTVYLQAYADEDGNGAASSLYFPNRHLPMKADLFNRAAWQIRTRTGASVYAWMPAMAFEIPQGMEQLRVEATHGGHKHNYYPRLSPFNPDARKIIRELYSDLARHAHIDGVLFHDDAFLTDFEDSSDLARQEYTRQGLGSNISSIRSSTELMSKWSRFKTQYLIMFTMELMQEVKKYRPRAKSVRNLYARVLLQPQAETWMAQNVEAFLSSYDYSAVMAMPFLEGEKESTKWLEKLIEAASRHEDYKEKLVFELQARDWRNNNFIAEDLLIKQMALLRSNGIGNYAYYPDDFIVGRPNINSIHGSMSLRDFPF